jgi:hypothetical protein
MATAGAQGGRADEGIFRSCLDQEQQGYDALKTRWSGLSSFTQTWCHEVATAAGTRNGSYFALDECVRGRAMMEGSPPQQFRW